MNRYWGGCILAAVLVSAAPAKSQPSQSLEAEFEVSVPEYPTTVVWTRDEKYLAWRGFYSGTIYVLDIKSRSIISTKHSYRGSADLAFSPDGEYLAIHSFSELELLKTDGWQSVAQVSDFPFPYDAEGIAFTPTGRTLWLEYGRSSRPHVHDGVARNYKFNAIAFRAPNLDRVGTYVSTGQISPSAKSDHDFIEQQTTLQVVDGRLNMVTAISDYAPGNFGKAYASHGSIIRIVDLGDDGASNEKEFDVTPSIPSDYEISRATSTEYGIFAEFKPIKISGSQVPNLITFDRSSGAVLKKFGLLPPEVEHLPPEVLGTSFAIAIVANRDRRIGIAVWDLATGNLIQLKEDKPLYDLWPSTDGTRFVSNTDDDTPATMRIFRLTHMN